MRIVIDASAMGELLLHSDEAPQIRAVVRSAGVDLHVPELIDIEVASALRKALFARELPETRLREALADYFDFRLVRHRHKPLLQRVLDLRHNFSAYDATYIALAEEIEAKLLTADAALARAVRRHLHLGVLP